MVCVDSLNLSEEKKNSTYTFMFICTSTLSVSAVAPPGLQ
jgi:hypothetical protein